MLDKIKFFLNRNYLQNSLLDYAIFIGIFFAGIIAVKIFKKLVLKKFKDWSEQTKTRIDDLLITLIEKTFLPLLYFSVFYVSIGSLKLSPALKKFVHDCGVIVFSIMVIVIATRLLGYILKNYRFHESKRVIPKGIISLLKNIIWVFGIIFILDNLGFKVSTVIAGLGIGGIAVAMASQTILKDLFNYFVILTDRPFDNGDFIVFGDFRGTVEHIGIKTTRLRTPGGEQLIVSNSDLTDSKISNYKWREKRRVIFTIGVGCDTSEKKLKSIPEIIKKIIENQKDVSFERAHFISFGDYSLDFEVVYIVNTTDYIRYLDVQQDINLAIKKEFDKLKIDMPFPTQAVIVNK